MRFAYIAAEKAFYPVEVLCDVLEVSRSGYYAWSKREPSERAQRDVELAADITAVHKSSRSTYGSPRVHAELRARGKRVGKKRVERLMRERGLAARQKRRFRRTTDCTRPTPDLRGGADGERHDARQDQRMPPPQARSAPRAACGRSRPGAAARCTPGTPRPRPGASRPRPDPSAT